MKQPLLTVDKVAETQTKNSSEFPSASLGKGGGFWRSQKTEDWNIIFRLFDVFSLFDVSLYTFKRRKRHSASFLNSHILPKNLFFGKMKGLLH